MSFSAFVWAMSQTAPSSAAKLLLLALANLVREPELKAFAKASTLAGMTQLNPKTVLSNLTLLEQAGLIVRLDERYGLGGAPVFRLAMPAQSEPEIGLTSEVPKSGSAPTFSAKSTQFWNPLINRSQSNPFEKKRARKTSTQKTDPVEAAHSLLPDVLRPSLADWLVVRKAKRAGALTPTAAKGLRREASKAGVSVQTAVDFCCEASWIGFRADWYFTRTAAPTKAQSNLSFREINAVKSALTNHEMSGGRIGRIDERQLAWLRSELPEKYGEYMRREEERLSMRSAVAATGDIIEMPRPALPFSTMPERE